MRDLANRLLTLERASAAGQARERVDLGALLDEVARDLQGRAAAQSVDLVLDLGRAPPVVMADRLMLREAVLNLIDNALRHGGPDLRQIKIGLAMIDGFARLWVSDDGRGLSADEVPLALARFGQVGTTEGSGLGLSITAAVVATHGGQLAIAPSTATPNGLSVTMILPLAELGQPAQMATSRAGEAANQASAGAGGGSGAPVTQAPRPATAP